MILLAILLPTLAVLVCILLTRSHVARMNARMQTEHRSLRTTLTAELATLRTAFHEETEAIRWNATGHSNSLREEIRSELAFQAATLREEIRSEIEMLRYEFHRPEVLNRGLSPAERSTSRAPSKPASTRAKKPKPQPPPTALSMPVRSASPSTRRAARGA